MSIVTGWGAGGWGEIPWNGVVPVEVTGVSATVSLGSETVTADAIVAVTGVSATSTLGNESVVATADVSVSGNAGTTGTFLF